MARKAILEGGKKDEIIAAATRLFFTQGYEKTSVRMVLEEVGGEVGMFYHYFRSKEELFDVAVQHFFKQYANEFNTMMADISDLDELIDKLLPHYEMAMKQYESVKDRMHWSIAAAMHEMTLLSLEPAVTEFLVRNSYKLNYPMDIASRKIIADISSAIHSDSFIAMDEKAKKELLLKLLRETIVQVI